MRRSPLVFALNLAVASTTAQVKDLSEVGQGLGPSNFDSSVEINCSSPVVPIPDDDPVGVTDTLYVPPSGTIEDLTVVIQATHTWCGDLNFYLTHEETGTSVWIAHNLSGAFGCSGDDWDAVLNDANGHSVYDVCNATTPSCSGHLEPYPGQLATFIGEELEGYWSMRVADYLAGDTGTFDRWCVKNDPGVGDGGPGDPDVPATTTWGVIALIALFTSASLFFLRRRSGANP